jgi:hypothetical protein
LVHIQMVHVVYHPILKTQVTVARWLDVPHYQAMSVQIKGSPFKSFLFYWRDNTTPNIPSKFISVSSDHSRDLAPVQDLTIRMSSCKGPIQLQMCSATAADWFLTHQYHNTLFCQKAHFCFNLCLAKQWVLHPLLPPPHSLSQPQLQCPKRLKLYLPASILQGVHSRTEV